MLSSQVFRWAGWVFLFIPYTSPVLAKPAEDLPSLLQKQIPHWLARYDVPGVSVALIQDSRPVWSAAFGVADTRSKEELQRTSVFQSESFAPTLTSWGILVLAEEHQIDLDKPVSFYLQRASLPSSGRRRSIPTLRQLLSRPTEWVMSQSHSDSRKKPDQPLPAEPVSSSRILEWVIEDVSGLSYAQYIRQRILRPMNMNAVVLPGESTPENLYALPHHHTGYPYASVLPDRANGFYASADDMARLVAAGLPSLQGAVFGYPVLGRYSIESMQQAAVETSGPTATWADSAGLGYLLEKTDRGILLLSNSGQDLPGWRHRFYSAPETGDGLVVMTNSDNGLALIRAIAGTWSTNRKLGNIRLVNFLGAVQRTVWVLTAACGLLAFGLSLYFLRELKHRRRHLPVSNWAPRIGGLAALAMACIASWTAGFNFLIEWLPYLSHWPAIAISSLAVVLSLFILFPAQVKTVPLTEEVRVKVPD